VIYAMRSLALLLILISPAMGQLTQSDTEGFIQFLAKRNDLDRGQPVAGQASVIDGDTIEKRGQRVRLWGIDAPESDQLGRGPDSLPYRCGSAAALALADKIGRSVVICEPRAVDRYKRTVAACVAAGVDLARWLVRRGLLSIGRSIRAALMPRTRRAPCVTAPACSLAAISIRGPIGLAGKLAGASSAAATGIDEVSQPSPRRAMARL
jgi:endonuclease YncB( thermonuclease family)